MNLKEKSKPFMYCFMGSGMLSDTYDKSVVEEYAIECEKIADEYAKTFHKWVEVCKRKGRPYDFNNVDELLRIFKEE